MGTVSTNCAKLSASQHMHFNNDLKVSKSDEIKFLLEVFHRVSTSQRKCIILWENIYQSCVDLLWKKCFWQAIDFSDDFLHTVLAIMVKYLFETPELCAFENV